MNPELDVEQVLELMSNGFTREGAAASVTVSHNESHEYFEALLAQREIQDAYDGYTRNGERTCTEDEWKAMLGHPAWGSI